MSVKLGARSFSFITYSFLLSSFLYVCPAHCASAKQKPKRLATPRPYFANLPAAPAPVIPAATQSSVTSTVVAEEVPNRVINLKLHPFYLMQMISDHETLAAGRVDLDFLVANRFSFGPSFIYQHSLFQETDGSGNKTTYEIGALLNEYLTETSSTGGLILREHAYVINPSASKSNSEGTGVNTTEINAGIRTGAELIYQKILKNGFNFEVGGGFTYNALPYSVKYESGISTEPETRFSPTINLAIGWAF